MLIVNYFCLQDCLPALFHSSAIFRGLLSSLLFMYRQNRAWKWNWVLSFVVCLSDCLVCVVDNGVRYPMRLIVVSMNLDISEIVHTM